QTLRGEPDQDELGAVEEVEDDDVARLDASGSQPRGEMAAVGPQLGVGPATVRGRVVQRGAIGVAVAVAVHAGQVGEATLKHLAKGRGVIAVRGTDAQSRALAGAREEVVQAASKRSRTSARRSYWVRGSRPSVMNRNSSTPAWL